MGKYIDLTGQRFERLVVIERYDDYIKPDGTKRVRWLCQCDCGKITHPTAESLRNGHTKSCGCLGLERATEAKKKTNRYDLSGEYGIGWTSNTNKEFYFDLEDYDKIKNYCWRENQYGYIIAPIEKSTNVIAMHRLVLNVKQNENVDVDHIKGYRTANDNRKNNLRICTHAENMRNQKLRTNNKSGVTGVHWDKRRNRWIATIKLNYKQKFLGSYINFDDAVKARREAEDKYFGEYSQTNSQNME